jgi:hypothetical protein
VAIASLLTVLVALLANDPLLPVSAAIMATLCAGFARGKYLV